MENKHKNMKQIRIWLTPDEITLLKQGANIAMIIMQASARGDILW
jgi:hypothetical protein